VFIARESLDLMILSILDDNPSGMTSYELLVALKEKMKTASASKAISAGTLYPKLQSLARAGLISEDPSQKKWVISPEGNERLMTMVPDFLDKSLQFLPGLFRALTKTLSPIMRVKYYSPLFHDTGHWQPDIDALLENLNPSDTEANIETLGAIKAQLDEALEHHRTQMEAIEQLVAKVDEKIQECKELEKKHPKRLIPVEGDDD
jgi:DNA-binding PadR family transcriptional regulator